MGKTAQDNTTVFHRTEVIAGDHNNPKNTEYRGYC